MLTTGPDSSQSMTVGQARQSLQPIASQQQSNFKHNQNRIRNHKRIVWQAKQQIYRYFCVPWNWKVTVESRGARVKFSFFAFFNCLIYIQLCEFAFLLKNKINFEPIKLKELNWDRNQTIHRGYKGIWRKYIKSNWNIIIKWDCAQLRCQWGRQLHLTK